MARARRRRQRYELAWVEARAQELKRWPADADCWCVFDNTAGGGAVSNALELRAVLTDHAQR